MSFALDIREERVRLGSHPLSYIKHFSWALNPGAMLSHLLRHRIRPGEWRIVYCEPEALARIKSIVRRSRRIVHVIPCSPSLTGSVPCTDVCLSCGVPEFELVGSPLAYRVPGEAVVDQVAGSESAAYWFARTDHVPVCQERYCLMTKK